jgi:hypothetical protein
VAASRSGDHLAAAAWYTLVLEASRAAHTTHPDLHAATSNRAAAWLALGCPAAALEDATSALRHLAAAAPANTGRSAAALDMSAGYAHPSAPRLLCRQGAALLALGRPRAALSCYEAAARLVPGHEGAAAGMAAAAAAALAASGAGEAGDPGVGVPALLQMLQVEHVLHLCHKSQGPLDHQPHMAFRSGTPHWGRTSAQQCTTGLPALTLKACRPTQHWLTPLQMRRSAGVLCRHPPPLPPSPGCLPPSAPQQRQP